MSCLRQAIEPDGDLLQQRRPGLGRAAAAGDRVGRALQDVGAAEGVLEDALALLLEVGAGAHGVGDDARGDRGLQLASSLDEPLYVVLPLRLAELPVYVATPDTALRPVSAHARRGPTQMLSLCHFLLAELMGVRRRRPGAPGPSHKPALPARRGWRALPKPPDAIPSCLEGMAVDAAGNVRAQAATGVRRYTSPPRRWPGRSCP
jgi:hypothetical protein